MRVISGKYKGKNIIGFNIDGTRPTMDRVKESMFASIQNYIKNAIVLDLFAGSGNLGIEALSNGASICYFVDNNKIAIDTINKNIIGIDNGIVIKKDCFDALYELKNIKFDIVLLDPPYHDNLLNKVLKKIVEYDLLNEDGIVVCEYEEGNIETSLGLYKHKKYGNKNVSIYKRG